MTWSGPVLAAAGAFIGSVAGGFLGSNTDLLVSGSQATVISAGFIGGTVGGIALALKAGGARRVWLTPLVMAAVGIATTALGFGMFATLSLFGLDEFDRGVDGVVVIVPVVTMVAFVARIVVERLPARRSGPDDGSQIAGALQRLGAAALAQGAPDEARRHLEESLTLAQRTGDRVAEANALHDLGSVARVRGDLDTARTLIGGALSIRRGGSDRRAVAAALSALGTVEAMQGHLDTGASLHAESLTLRRDLGDRAGIAESLEGLASVASARGRWRRAARLYGAASALREAVGARPQPFDLEHLERAMSAARAAAEPEGFDQVADAGRSEPLEDAVAYALEEPHVPEPIGAPPADEAAEVSARGTAGVPRRTLVAVVLLSLLAGAALGGGAFVASARGAVRAELLDSFSRSVRLQGDSYVFRGSADTIGVVRALSFTEEGHTVVLEDPAWRVQFRLDENTGQFCLETAEMGKRTAASVELSSTEGVCWDPGAVGSIHYCICASPAGAMLLVATKDHAGIKLRMDQGDQFNAVGMPAELHVPVVDDTSETTVMVVEPWEAGDQITDGWTFVAIAIGDRKVESLSARGDDRRVIEARLPGRCTPYCASDTFASGGGRWVVL